MITKSTSLILTTLLISGLVLVGCGDDDSDDDSNGETMTGVNVFITSATFNGNLGGLDGADTICTDAAVAAGLTGTWTAWLSGRLATEYARDRIVDAQYQLLDGTVVANDLADLTDGALAAAIDMNELRNTVAAGQNVWTATAADGTNPGYGICNPDEDEPAWTSELDTRQARVGEVAVDATWTDLGLGTGGANDCDSTNHLYCFSNDEFDL